MNTVQRIAKNTIALFISQIVLSIFGLVLSVLLARLLGDIEYGKYNFAVAFTSLFSTFIGLGYSTLMIREVARDKSLINKYYGNISAIYLVMAIVINIALVITINLMHYPSDTKTLVYIFGISTSLGAIASVSRITFRIYEKMEYEMYTVIIREVIKSSLGIALLLLGYGLRQLAYIFLLAGILDILISFYFCKKKFITPRLEFDFSFWAKTFKIAAPLALLSIFGLIYTRIDTVMLSAMKGDAVVGLYNAANNLTQNLKPFPQFFLNAILPIISIYYLSSTELLKIAYEKAFKYLFIVSLPMSIGLFLLSNRVITFLYGSNYIQSTIVLQILSFEILLMFMYQCLGFILVSINKQNNMAIAAGIGAFVNIIFNLILIPKYSYTGSAIATIITEITLFGIYYYWVSKYLVRLKLQYIVISPIIASIAMGFFIYSLRHINLIILIVASTFIYFIVLFFTRGLSLQDIHLIKQVIKKIPKKKTV